MNFYEKHHNKWESEKWKAQEWNNFEAIKCVHCNVTQSQKNEGNK